MIKQVGIVLAVIVAYGAREMLRHHWMFITPQRADFQKPVQFKEKAVPVIYYEPGKLGEKLTAWEDRFVLYRIAEGFNYTLDPLSLPDSTIVGHRVPSEDLLRPESAFCKRGFDDVRPEMINVSQVYTEPGWYASFSRVTREAAARMWEELRLPFEVKESELEHGFFSNFEHSTVTSPIHGAPMVNSMAIQFVGRKSWLFFPPKTYLSDQGFRATPAASVLVPQKAPDAGPEDMEVYVYTSQPGDVLFFQESWGHLVYTHKGPSLMINYRNMIPKNVLRQPVTFFHALLNHLFLGIASNNNKVTNTWPDKSISFAQQCTQKLYAAVCPPPGSQPETSFDRELIKFLHSRVDKFDA